MTWAASQLLLILPFLDLYANARLALYRHWQGHQPPTHILSVGWKDHAVGNAPSKLRADLHSNSHCFTRGNLHVFFFFFLWLPSLPGPLCIPCQKPRSFSAGRRQIWRSEAVPQDAVLLPWSGTDIQGWGILSYYLILIITSVCNVNLAVSSPLCDSRLVKFWEDWTRPIKI